jgi:hypothetical protein
LLNDKDWAGSISKGGAPYNTYIALVTLGIGFRMERFSV